MAVNYATKLRVVIFNTHFRFANSAGTDADACNSVYYITLLWFNKYVYALFLGHPVYSNDKQDRTWKEVIVTYLK